MSSLLYYLIYHLTRSDLILFYSSVRILHFTSGFYMYEVGITKILFCVVGYCQTPEMIDRRRQGRSPIQRDKNFILHQFNRTAYKGEIGNRVCVCFVCLLLFFCSRNRHVLFHTCEKRNTKTLTEETYIFYVR